MIVGTALVVACEGSFTTVGSNAQWGFITIAAAKNAAGDYRSVPLGQFFKGSLSSVPNAQIVFDSCVPGLAYSEASEIVSGVTFLDAGDNLTLQLGSKTETLPRLIGTTSTTYQKGLTAPVSYTPGDSIVVTVPGATGGYPAAEIRGRTAEPFTNDQVAVPTGTETIKFHWTPATDLNSAMIISMRYRSANATSLSAQILCAFTDDGADSVPYRIHRFWSDASNTQREVVFTRLRTAIKSQGAGVLEIISRYQTPVPVLP
ncbi:MAG: hypothetical protein U0163_02385 [Gemmatimonadaceae bacterium]